MNPDPDTDTDPDPIRKIFFDQKLQFIISKLQEKTSALKIEHPALKKKMKFVNFFLCLLAIFALLDPDTDPGTPLNPDSIRIRIHSTGYGYYKS